MRLYDNADGDNYENLKVLYPVWYRDVLEMDAIWHALGPQLDGIQSGLTQAVDNGFIWTSNEPTITKLEQFLYIPVVRSKPLIERKTLVASFVLGNGHIGEKEIKALIGMFTDGEITVALIGGAIDISVTREISDRFNLADCLYILLKKIPAHLGLALRDILLPIVFRNENFLRFQAFGVHGRFFSRGPTKPILLDGQHLLDGSWLLDQAFHGIVFRKFCVATSFFTSGHADLPRYVFATSLTTNAATFRAETAHFRLPFFNNSETEQIMLDGRRTLNGSWLLNQKLRGVIFPSFGIAVTATTPERVYSTCIAFSHSVYRNAYRGRMESIGLAQGVRNKNTAKYETLQFGLPGTRPHYALRGSVTIDSMYELNGTVRLDGSRKLNAQIIKEDF